MVCESTCFPTVFTVWPKPSFSLLELPLSLQTGTTGTTSQACPSAPALAPQAPFSSKAQFEQANAAHAQQTTDPEELKAFKDMHVNRQLAPQAPASSKVTADESQATEISDSTTDSYDDQGAPRPEEFGGTCHHLCFANCSS